jgi:energy-coupling factor transport system permease protein
MNLLKIQQTNQKSIFSRLDFLTKLYLIVIISVVAFIWENPFYQIILTTIVIAACIISGVKWKYVFTILVIMLPFYSFLLLTHAFFNHDHVISLLGKQRLSPIFMVPENWWLIGGVYPTWEGFWYGVNIIFKALTLTLVIPLGIFTTNVDEMMVSLLRIKVPYKIIFIFSSTLRFFPLLIDEFNKIIEAQKLRGVGYEGMGLFKRVGAYSRVAVPLILGAFVKSQQLEIVLQAKGFSGDPDRTYLHDAKITLIDIMVLLLVTVFFAAVIFLRITNHWGTFAMEF